MKRLLTLVCVATVVGLASVAGTASAADINGGSSWGSWNHLGNSLDVGIWAGNGTARDYELYSTVFTFNNDPITGSPTQIGPGPIGFAAGPASLGAFSNGNTILGIGLDYALTASNVGPHFVNFDLNGDSFVAATSLGGTDGVFDAFSPAGEVGDFSIWMDGINNGPSNLGVNTDGLGTVANLVGGIGSGTSYDFAFRHFTQGNVGGSTQMFFDLTAMQTLYGVGGTMVVSPLPIPFSPGGWDTTPFPIGAFSDNFRVGLFNSEANFSNNSGVTFGVSTTVPEPSSLTLLSLGAIGCVVARRRRKIA